LSIQAGTHVQSQERDLPFAFAHTAWLSTVPGAVTKVNAVRLRDPFVFGLGPDRLRIRSQYAAAQASV